MTVSNYSTTAANNTTINSISIAEGMPPSNVNNAIRNQLSDIRSFLNDKEWFIVGDRDGAATFTRASGTSVTVASTNVTADYHANRRVKVVGANTGTLYGKVASSSFSTNTTINFTFDSGTISGSDTNVDVFVGSPFTNPAIPVIDDNSLGTSQVLPPSQGSVKTYVDAQITAQDLDVSDGSTAIAIDLDSETLGLLGGTGIDSTASGNNVTMAIDSTVATLTGSQTLTNKTLTNPTINTGTLANSTINNATLTTPDLNGSELILDADQDTSITADTDDKIDIKIGGSDKISATSSALTIGDNNSDYNTTMKGMLTINPVTSSGVVTALNLPQGDALQFGSGNTVIYKDRTSGVNYFRGDGTLSIKSDGVNIGNASLTSDRATIQSGFSGNTGDVTINHANLTTGTSNRLLTHSTGLNLYGAIQFKDTSNNNTASIDASGNITATNLGTISSQASNNVAITGGSITGLGSPTQNDQATTKLYVDNLVTGLKTRIIVRAATTGNIDLTQDLQNGDTLDGVTLATDDKVLVKDQSNNTQNGIYVVASGTASRDPDFDNVDELAGQMIIVKEGSVNADSFQLCTTDSGTIGSAAITFTQVTPSNTGTVTSIGLAQSGSEFTISGSPITTSGNITLGINTIANTKISGLGTASTKAVGTSADNVVQLDGSARLPAVDGSQLTNLPSTGATNGFAIAMAIAL
jgi:hypothetical protein